jgi:hypothetical protein
MTQFETEVPEPLRDDLPRLLSGGRVTTPASLSSCSLSSSASCGSKAPRCKYRATTSAAVKARLSQSGEEQLVDDPVTCEANAALRLACRMGRHYDAATQPLRSHSHLWAVVELAHQGAFWARELPISRQVQAALDLGLIQHGVVLASRHKAVASQLEPARLPCHTGHPAGAAHTLLGGDGPQDSS